MKHMFKPGEKEAVASILGIPVEEMPDVLNLGEEDSDDDEDEESDSEDEDEDEDEEETEDEDDEDDEDSDEDEDAEDSVENVELLQLKDEWQRSASSSIPFSEFLKSRGK
jgi:hypothetical protein